MALYAIGAIPICLWAGARSKPMDVFGDKWENHAEKLQKGFSRLTEDDLCVVCGDMS